MHVIGKLTQSCAELVHMCNERVVVAYRFVLYWVERGERAITLIITLTALNLVFKSLLLLRNKLFDFTIPFLYKYNDTRELVPWSVARATQTFPSLSMSKSNTAVCVSMMFLTMSSPVVSLKRKIAIAGVLKKRQRKI